MFALVNTFNASVENGSVYGGRVISMHRTIEAALAADEKYQRAVKRANGQNCWVPTKVMAADRRLAKGALINGEYVRDPEGIFG